VRGGRAPRWTTDGSRLLYSTPEGEIFSASVRSVGETLEISTPELLFDLPFSIYGDYDVTSDRVLLAERATTGADQPLTLVLGWDR
jgi:hypothetical protein